MSDVADAAGLSPASVSYALRGLHVPVETQERVRRAADELGYEVNPIARALASGRTATVGLLCSSLEDLWQQRLVVELGRGLLAEDLFPIIADAHGRFEREEHMLQQLRMRHVDGLIVLPLDPNGEYWADLTGQLPVVTIGNELRHARPAAAVVFDNERGIDLALSSLAALGHERVAVLLPTQPGAPPQPDEALAAAAARHGLRLILAPSPASVDGAAAVAARLLAALPAPTAFFCLSDSMAYGVYLAAAKLTMAIPAQLSVVGYDDHEMSKLLFPPLTTFHWDVERIVQIAVGEIVRIVDDPGATEGRTVVRPALEQRGSTCAVAVVAAGS